MVLSIHTPHQAPNFDLEKTIIMDVKRGAAPEVQNQDNTYHFFRSCRSFCLPFKGVVVLNKPPYSSDLFPYDYLLFPKLKLLIKRTIFNGIPDIQATATDYLTQIAKTNFQNCFDDYYINGKKCVQSSEV